MVQKRLDQVTDSFGLADCQELTFFLYFDQSSPFGNPESTELESGIQYSESGIQRVESRIQDCHGFLYMGRQVVQRFSLLTIVRVISKATELFPQVFRLLFHLSIPAKTLLIGA